MEHDPDCVGNHSDNPFTTPEREVAYREFVVQALRMCVLTVDVSVEVTYNYAALAVFCATSSVDPSDPLPTQRAVLYELARLVNHTSGGKPPEFHTSKVCAAGHDHSDEALTPTEHFGDQMLRAFFTASCEGDLRSAVRVMEAARAEATEQGSGEHAFAAALFVNALISLAVTHKAQMDDPMVLFED